ncbi:MAG: hypothetical protein Q7S34_01760 [bacterium]|nr:hypothetical protein [bacterium]
MIFKKFVESKQTNTEWEIITKGVDLRNSDSLRELAEDLRKKVSLRSLDLPPDVSKFIEEGLEVKIGEIFEDDVKSQSFTERETPGVVNWFT